MRGRDERLKRMSDLLSSVRLVKMYAWEEAYIKTMKQLRDIELVPVFMENILDGLVDSLYSSSSSMLIIILFGTLSALDPSRSLNAALSFSSVYILSMTDMLTSSAGQLLRSRSMVAVCMRRIANFCTLEELDPQAHENDEKTTKTGAVILEKCTFTWTKRKGQKTIPALSNISLDVAPGTLVGVTGFVGSGKSSLLSAILGDLHCVEGDIRTKGRIGYVPQVACVYNMTIRDNILFGQELDPVRYNRVLRACELLNDLNTFPAGDLTEVGERGETLSGGQKQRLSLARAAYSNSNIYLLDDPLSALDPNVASRVFRQVLGRNGLLKNTTRFLVSNQGNILQHMDILLLMHGKTATMYKTLSDLTTDDRAPETLRIGASSSSKSALENSMNDADLDQDEETGRITVKETDESQRGAIQVIWSILKMSGICVPIGMLFFVASAVALAWQQLWIKNWTDAEAMSYIEEPSSSRWVKGLVALCLSDVLFRMIGSVLLAASCQQLSRTLHHTMLTHVLFSPVSFFDSTPRGRILNRFSVDLDAIDGRLFISGKQSVQGLLVTLSKIAVVGTQTPEVMIVAAVGAAIIAAGMVIIVKASNSLRFHESTQTSRVLQLVTEIADSISLVRAFGVVERFCHHFCRMTDQNMRPYSAFCGCFRVSRGLAGFCGLLIVAATLVFSIFFPTEAGSPDEQSSSVGLALSSSLSIPMAISNLCMVLYMVLQLLVSLERDVEYSELPMETDLDVQKDPKSLDRNRGGELQRVLTADEHWPREGRLEFRNYSASYRPGRLPDVLQKLAFVVEPKERVGVVGRTGAGKSSLVLALLRVLRSSKGCICIDGVDISDVSLKKLRNAVTVIPQDPTLVRGSLRDNLDPTRRHTDEELWQALEQAHLGDFVSKHSEKLLLETGAGGSNLSVGQRQLVCLARALLRCPKILVLDEATSQMDGDTDRLIQATLRKSFANCTLLAIAHRLHTVLDYDKILVMNEGKVLEYGPVDLLLSDPSSAFSGMARSAGMLDLPRRGSGTLGRTRL